MEEQKTIRIEKIVPGGSGLGHAEDGRVVLMDGVLPEEKVRYRETKVHKNWSFAESLEILEASTYRRTEPCPYAGECGGCQFQHVEDTFQRKLKQDMVREACLRTGGFDPGEIPIVGSSFWNYRNRMQLHRGNGRLGLRSRNSHRLIPLDSCLVAHSRINSLLASEGDFADLQDRFQVFADDRNLYIQGRHEVVETRVAEHPIRFSMNGFFQSNLKALEMLVTDLLADSGGREMMDLFCGAGLFGSLLKDRFSRIVAVEKNSSSVALARINIGLEKGKFYTGKVEKYLRDRRQYQKTDLVVTDPPRGGLQQDSVKALTESGIPRIVYISCNPVTLARDIGRLSGRYRLESLRLYDFYPQTSHVEAVAKLSIRG